VEISTSKQGGHRISGDSSQNDKRVVQKYKPVMRQLDTPGEGEEVEESVPSVTKVH
jgi:hypothetical protein